MESGEIRAFSIPKKVVLMAEKIEFRCEGCGKLLCNTDGNTDIVCPRCSGLNKLNIATRQITFISRKMRQRTSSSGLRFQ